MSVVSVLNVTVNDNPAAFGAPYEFEITFECLEALQKDLEWKLTYVGSATSSEHDQVLDTLLVGPVPIGINKFIFQADPPDLTRIPNTEIIGVTVILLSCAYDEREFVRIGYYVNNEYTDEALSDDPPAKPVVEKVRRSILAEKPRVTRFAIKWDSESSAPPEFPPEQPEADAADDDEAKYGAEEEEEDEEEEEGEEEEEEETAKDELGVKQGTGDLAMGGTGEETIMVHHNEEDDDPDAGSEDLEDESSGSEDEEEEEDGGGVEGDDHEMDVDETSAEHRHAQQADVMVH